MRGIVLVLSVLFTACASFSGFLGTSTVPPCDPELFEADAEAFAQNYMLYCRAAEAPPDDMRHVSWLSYHESWQAFREADMASVARNFEAQHRTCYQGETNSYAAMVDACVDADPNYAAAWSDRIDWVVETDVPNRMATLAREAQQGRNEYAADTSLSIVGELQELSQMPPSEPRLASLLSQTRSAQEEFEAAALVEINERRCPWVDKSPKLSRELHSFYQEKLNAETDLKQETAINLRVSGRRYRDVDAFNVVHESVSATACVKQVTTDDVETCRIYELTFKRTRGRGKWGTWSHESADGGERIVCEKIR